MEQQKGKSKLEKKITKLGKYKLTNISLLDSFPWVWNQSDVSDLQFYPKTLYFLNCATNQYLWPQPRPNGSESVWNGPKNLKY